MTRLALALLALVLLPDAAAAKLPCLEKWQVAGKQWKYRQVEPDKRCYYVGEKTRHKDEFDIKPVKPAKSSSGGSGIAMPEKSGGDQKPKLGAGEAPEAAHAHGRSFWQEPPSSRRGGPAPEQARLERAFNELQTLWATMHMAPWQVRAIYEWTRLDYAQRWPAWEMASRWP